MYMLVFDISQENCVHKKSPVCMKREVYMYVYMEISLVYANFHVCHVSRDVAICHVSRARTRDMSL